MTRQLTITFYPQKGRQTILEVQSANMRPILNSHFHAFHQGSTEADEQAYPGLPHRLPNPVWGLFLFPCKSRSHLFTGTTTYATLDPRHAATTPIFRTLRSMATYALVQIGTGAIAR